VDEIYARRLVSSDLLSPGPKRLFAEAVTRDPCLDPLNPDRKVSEMSSEQKLQLKFKFSVAYTVSANVRSPDSFAWAELFDFGRGLVRDRLRVEEEAKKP